MNTDTVTTTSGVLAAVSLAMSQYAQTNPEISGISWYLGLIGAVGLAVWAYFTNKGKA